MPHDVVDLRSDTVTRPTPGMQQAIANAQLGDDVFGEDPTTNALQERLADMLGKESALFVPSGTMSNQLGVRVHCKPGDEFLCEAWCHIYNYEQGAFASLSGVAVRPVEGEFGVLRPEQLVDMIRPENPHMARTKLVCLENTHNRGAGRIQPYEYVEAICTWAHANGLATHLDGARLFNAAVATGIDASRWAQHFDTVSVCFSKGLGAPVGSALAGPRDMIKEAYRHRKAFGGAMRQAGVIAGAALYALDHHIDRLADDHVRARRLADAIRQTPGLSLYPDTIDTNIVIFRVSPDLGSAANFTGRLEQCGVRMLAFNANTIRAVTHLDVDDADIDRACETIERVAQEAAGKKPTVAAQSAYA